MELTALWRAAICGLGHEGTWLSPCQKEEGRPQIGPSMVRQKDTMKQKDTWTWGGGVPLSPYCLCDYMQVS